VPPSRLRALCSLVAFALAAPAGATAFTVLNTNDSGAGSLRQAILDANGSAGSDRIEFAIPGSGVQTITPATALPAITGTVVIDGYTQPGASANTQATGTDAILIVELAGGGSGNGLTVSATACTIQGLVIRGFGVGISIDGASNIVAGDYIGVDATGTLDRGNSTGILIGSLAGTDNRIGGSLPAERNVISGNDTRALRTIGDRTTIAGNYIGTNAAGTAAIANGQGVVLERSSNLVGGTNATPGGGCTGACNLISGNAGNGVFVGAALAVAGQNEIRGNYVGTDVTGQSAIPNADGIAIADPDNQVGLATGTAADRNVVSGNSNRGIYLTREGTNASAANNTIARNFVGLSSTGGALGNGGRGIELQDAKDNLFTENTIGHNGGTGLYHRAGLIQTGLNNHFERNAIFASGGLAIDLEVSIPSPPRGGVTPNDPGDADGAQNQPNRLQNFPILFSAASSGGGTEVRGTLNSTPGSPFLIELFASSSCDPSGFGEAETFVDDLMVSTDMDGNTDFVVTLPAAAPGTFLTATATDSGGSTSELSACREVDRPRPIANDFDGDGGSDVATYRPATGFWFLLRSTSGSSKFGWGEAGDLPAPGDFDGDGVTDIAVFRPGTGEWYVRASSAGGIFQPWGEAGDVPVPADYDGDGITDIAVYRPSNGVWYILRSRGDFLLQQWGQPGDLPVPADFDGDGRTDIAIFRPTEGWYLAQTSAGGLLVPWGSGADEPLPADYDGDGRADLGIFRPSEGSWYLHRSTAVDILVPWGENGDIPVSGDYDGDGPSDLGVFRPSEGAWYLLQSTAGPLFVPWGESQDKPIGGRPQ